GNDFVIIDNISQGARLHGIHYKRLADRHFGIGCDQIIVIEPPQNANADFFYRVYNADGREVEQCGNGARCAAKWVYELGLVDDLFLQADCLAGPISFKIEPEDKVGVYLSIPKIHSLNKPIEINNKTYLVNLISIGNPHRVVFLENNQTSTLATLGPLISKLPDFQSDTNVELVHIVSPHEINVEVYERGSGTTLACGSGACAIVAAGIQLGLLEKTCAINFAFGQLKVSWEGADKPIYLSGPTTRVFTGQFRI
ncbi:MAG: diaminopimelate epimerase, partial [Francisellaceae bacterium]|nr:diaminopimelate epimerase [Francisellaceae bacterium]